MKNRITKTSLVLATAALGLGISGPDGAPSSRGATPAGTLRLHHPHDVIADVAMSPGYPDDPRMFVASPGTMNLFLTSSDHGVSWRHSRTGIAGKTFKRVELAPDWNESGVGYVVTEDRGLQVSTDFCRTWPEPAFPQQRLQHLAVAPLPEGEDPARVLYTATTAKLFRSDDGGANFEEVALPLRSARIQTIALSPSFPTDGTLALAMSDGRVLLSEDRGAKWRTSRLPAAAKHVAFSPQFARDRQLWVATWSQGVLRSRDAGATFEPVNEGLTDLDVNHIAVADSKPGFELYLATRDDGVFQSNDAGSTWQRTALRVDKTVQTDNHHTRVVVSPGWPADRTVACCTYEGLYLSRDGGASWTESNVNPTRIGRHVKTSPNFATDGVAVAVGYGMQMMVSEDHGANWDIRFAGIRADSVYSIGVSPEFADDGIIMLGVWHGIRRTTDLGKTWEAIEVPPDPNEKRKKVGYTMRSITYSPNFAEDRTVHAISNWGVLYRSTDAGLSWQMVRRVSKFTASFALTPEYPKDPTLFVGGGQGVWRSPDDGQNFEHVLKGSIAPNTIVVAPDFATTGTVFCVDRFDGFMIGSDRGKTWEPSNDGLQGFSPVSIQLSPKFAADGTIYLLAAGGGFFQSTDRGRSWQRVSTPGAAVDQGFCMALSSNFDADQTALVGTYTGFQRTVDAGRTWEPVTATEVYDDKRDPWRRHGSGWQFRFDNARLNQSISVSNRAGDMISVPFNGRAFRLFGPRGPQYGIAEVWVDGELLATVDGYAEQAEERITLAEADLPEGPHTLTLFVTGEKNPAARDAWAGVDAIEVTFR